MAKSSCVEIWDRIAAATSWVGRTLTDRLQIGPERKPHGKAAQHAPGALKLKGDEQLTPQLQDRIFSEFLIPKAGDGSLGNLLNRGEGTVDQAQLAAARKWASVAVPAGYPTKERGISDGTMSYFPPPANKASIEATRALREFLTDLAR